MKNLKLIVIALFLWITNFPSDAYSQIEEINCKLVLKGSTDTLNKWIIIKRKGLNKKGMAFKDVLGKKLSFRKSNGATEKISIKEVNRLEFTDFHEINRVFIDEPQVGLKDDKNNLVEEVHKGTVSLYRRYKVQQPDVYTGAVYIQGDEYTGLTEDRYKPATMGNVLKASISIMGIDFFIYKDYPARYINLYEKGGRERLVEMMKDRPDLEKRILTVKNYKELVQILKDYDTDPEIVKQRIIANSESTKAEEMKDFTSIHIDSLKTQPLSSADELKVGDFIKYVGPGQDKVGLVIRIISSRSVLMKYDLKTEPKEFQVRISDVELIVE